jgi:HD-like signal output (HDOD) protein
MAAPDKKVAGIAEWLTDFPSLPRVVEQLLSLSPSDATTRDFADLIATDQGLSAKVLRLVNSAFYSLRTPISSIRQASALLGIRTLKSLALSVSVIQIFKRRPTGYDPVRFWHHALAVALAGRKIAERIHLPFQDEVYIAGLLHDIGLPLLVERFPKEFARVASPGSEGLPAALALEEEAFGQTHPELGYSLASHWRLLPLVSGGLRHHHTPPAQLPVDLDREGRMLILVVQLADGYARRFGYPFSDADRLDPLLPLEPAPELALDAAELEGVVGKLDQAIAELEPLFSRGKKEAAGHREKEVENR